jgi:ABC-type lipoprotein release transport system permease subunit
MEVTPIIFILGIVLGVAAILTSAAASEGDKQRIRQHLVERGTADIFISRAWTPGDRATHTYDVAFIDSQGEQRRTRCKIRRIGWFSGREIDWEDPV